MFSDKYLTEAEKQWNKDNPETAELLRKSEDLTRKLAAPVRQQIFVNGKRVI